jgi:hypothetical protein
MINFISITNNGYISFADNQIENFKKVYLKSHKLYLYCFDEESYHYHSKKDLPENIILRKLDKEITGHHSYNEGKFVEITRLKFPLIVNCINEFKTPVWFIDNDILILKDPEPYVDKSRDMLFQADMGDYPSRYGWVCTGCFWINNTEKSISFLKKLIDLQYKFNRNEQEILNDYCKSWPASTTWINKDLIGEIINFKDAKLDILSYYLFQNGNLAFKNNQFDKHECVMIHFNHERDYNLKINNLIKTKKHYNYE